MKTKIIIGILALAVVAILGIYMKSNPPTSPPVQSTTTTQPATQPSTPTTSPAENQAINAVDQELGSAVQGISDSDVQNAITS